MITNNRAHEIMRLQIASDYIEIAQTIAELDEDLWITSQEYGDNSVRCQYIWDQIAQLTEQRQYLFNRYAITRDEIDLALSK